MAVGDGSRVRGRSQGSGRAVGRRTTANNQIAPSLGPVGVSPVPNEVPLPRRSARTRGRITTTDNQIVPSLSTVDILDQDSIAIHLAPEVGDKPVPNKVRLPQRSSRNRGRVATADNEIAPSITPVDVVDQASIASKLATEVEDNPVPNKVPRVPPPVAPVAPPLAALAGMDPGLQAFHLAPEVGDKPVPDKVRLPQRSSRSRGRVATANNEIAPSLTPVDVVDQASIASKLAPEVVDNAVPNEVPRVPPPVAPIASPLATLAGMDPGLQAFLQLLVTQVVTEVVTQVVPLVVPQVVQAVETTVVQAPLQQPPSPPLQPPPEEQRRGFSSTLTMIAKMNPPKFEGSFEDMENWLAEMEKLFAVVGCPEEEKVPIASCYLQKGFYKCCEDSKLINHDSTWEEFKAMLEERYNLRALREAKLIEFLNPKSEDETVAQATVKYFQLLRYASSVVQNEKDKIRYFDMRMNAKIRLHMLGHSCGTLEEYIDRTLALELIMAEADERLGTQSSKKQKTESASGTQDSGFRRPDSAPDHSRKQKTQAAPAPSSEIPHRGSQGRAPAGCRSWSHGSEQHRRKGFLKPLQICRGCGAPGHPFEFCGKMIMEPSQSQTFLWGPVGQAHPAPPQSLRKLDRAVDPQTKSPPCVSCLVEFDGASKGNPGISGAGAVLRADDGSVVFLLREGVGIATSSVAEYRAIILGLKYALSNGYKHVRALGDSQMVCMQIQGLQKCRKPEMAKLCKEAVDLKERFSSFKIEHIFREFNAEADSQANQATILRDGEVEVDRFSS